MDGGSAQFGVGDHLVSLEARCGVGEDELERREEMRDEDKYAILDEGEEN